MYRACWRYQDTYECLSPNNIDYCAGIRQIAGCNQTSSVCTQRAFNGECLVYTNTYRCGDAIKPPQGVVQLDSTYTVTTDTIDRSQCSSYENNPSCTLAQKTCTEPGGTRIINGLPVTKDCWKWEETYSCITQNYRNYCIPLRQTAGCTEVSNTCKSYAWNNSCNEYERTYRCDGRQGEPLPQNVTYLNTQYTITKDQLNTSQCDPSKNNPNCTLASRTCTQPGGTRNINGLDVYKDCWEWTDEYVCASDQLQSDCDELRNNPACSEQSSTCLDSLPSSQCGLLERSFRCQVRAGSTEETVTCGTAVCVDGVCTEPATDPDQDFAGVVTALEAAREMGVYLDPTTMQMFKGVAGKCSKKLGGVSNCCKGGSGSTSSNNYMIEGIKMIGDEAVRFAGSTYMYDALFASDLVPSSVLNALYGGGTGSSYTFGGDGGIGFYGVTFSIGADGALVVGFDPYSFAIAIATQIVMEFLACEQEEQVLAMRKAQNLCHYVGSYCSKKVLGACIEKKEGYCCFNSRLARIINEQGRVQLGKGWGSPRNPDCSGFTQDDLAQIDFSQMNLAEFFRDIVPKQLNTNLLTDRANTTVQNKVNNYFDQ